MQNEKTLFDLQYVKTLFTSFTEKIEDIQANAFETIEKSRQCAFAGKEFLEELRQKLQDVDFASTEDEIQFFKHLKPLFSAQLIYHSEVYHIALRRPQGSLKQQELFFMDEYDRINLFCGVHHDIYRYYRSQQNHLDLLYFTRKTHSSQPHLDLPYSEFDPSFSTGYDLLIARFIANEMLSDHLTRSIEELHEKTNPPQKAQKSELEWTAPVVALVELIVALDSYAAFNNGSVGIGRLAIYFSSQFNIRISNIHKTYEEIRIRKKNRTVFLDNLKLALNRKMDIDDENAR